jgi:Cdc6-like AAA superfamily ATPase
MTQDDIIRMAREAGWLHEHDSTTGFVSEAAFKFAVLVGTQEREECLKLCRRMIEIAIADEREKVADWMIHRGYATGHGDTIQDLLKELNWQAKERERKACAKVVTDNAHMFATLQDAESLAAFIRARGMQ